MNSSKIALRSSGLATTSQRALILKCLRERTDHPDAEMVYKAVHEQMPKISLDTVYRTLKIFSKSGLALQLAVPTHRFRFDGCMSAHDHFMCSRCEAIFDIPVAHGKKAAIPDAARKIGKVQAVQRVFIGICRSCREKARGTRTARKIRASGQADRPRGAVRAS